MRAAILILVLALATVACGDERKGAADAATDWFAAVDEGDTKKACDLMLPTATRSLQSKYVDRQGLACPELVREYRKSLPDKIVDQIREVGFVASGDIDDDRIGTFPRSGSHEFSVVLMERKNDEWKVASVGLGAEPVAGK